MTRATPSRRFAPIALALIATAACWPVASAAQTASAGPAAPAAQPAGDDTLRLTDEQRMAIIDGNTPERAAAARGELSEGERARRGIHGEVGAMIGSNGSHAIYGVAEIPLGQNGSAVIAFENSQYNFRRR